LERLQEVCETVLSRVEPTREDRRRISKLVEDLKAKLGHLAEEEGYDLEVALEGSVAKDTWLREDPEADIFLLFPPSIPKREFRRVSMKIAKRATTGYRQLERFAEHPYLECYVDDVRVNIVPCYKVSRGAWISSTDRTPYHTLYVKSRLNRRMRRDVRLLKRFMKGIGVYGAEIRVGGFSGYLCELLIIYYGSFHGTLVAASEWREKEVVDLEGFYGKKREKLFERFNRKFIVVDPIDENRNVAAGVTDERFNEFIAASRAFLEKPSVEFFYPPEVKPLRGIDLKEAFRKRGSAFVFIKFGEVEAVPDVLWGQLYRSLKAITRKVEESDFQVLRNAVWSREGKMNMFLLEIGSRRLPHLKRHVGPPVTKRIDSANFIEKYKGNPQVMSGPYIEGSRWVVWLKRQYSDVADFLKAMLKEGGRQLGVASRLSEAFREGFEILVDNEILEFYFANPDFAKFLTEFMRGRPFWL